MPKARATALLLLLLAATSASAAPPQKTGTKQVAALTGQCTHLAVAGHLIDDPCNGQALGTTYPNGRVGFTFSVEQSFTLEFAGNGARKQPLGNLGNVQPVDTVIFRQFQKGALGKGGSGRLQQLKATGKCVYGDAFSGDPITIVCEGATAKGRFEVTFETDGGSPG
ncbi:hypothetical protein [Novosphingobium terrae]|uniref:hypothetical protein n=1 Tax=Novosphingobium terrae TaxID=2726189 RepID=UPI00197E270F|nr:hypothetical protein [Novosphingobium terrae]